MLLKIREKSQGLVARFILVLICLTFALWGIQNYTSGSSETAVVKVGSKEFFQQDVNNAYIKYSQNLPTKDFDENTVKKQALEKLIRDEILLQHVEQQGLVITDNKARDFIKNLDYFQSDEKFDRQRYKSMLSTQRISQKDFAGRIKKALLMDQFQRSLTESAFATHKDIENFFKIQNQKRDMEVIVIALQPVEQQPSQEEIEIFYKKNKNKFLTEEQVAIEYVQLSLDDLAADIKPTDEELNTFYEEGKDLYTTKERRKISHILFSFNEDSADDEKQLARAVAAKKTLQNKAFAELAREISDDKVTAEKGGDLGLFNVGVMEKAFEDAVNSLQLEEISEPVKSAFGYHLIQVTELIAGETKAFSMVKDELTVAYKRQEAETSFYELGETLSQVSYENPDDLIAAAALLDVQIMKTELFGKNKSTSEEKEKTTLINNTKVIEAAFSEDVLKGNNSEPIELASDKLIVLRIIEHKLADTKPLNEVSKGIISVLLGIKSKAATIEKMKLVKDAVASGQSMQEVAKANGFKVQSFSALTRTDGGLTRQVNQAVFKAAKPIDEKPTLLSVSETSGVQTVVNLLAVAEGVMSEDDKAKQQLAEDNIAKAFGQAEFNATINSLQASAIISINLPE
ncbi:MAG: peptidylprolyl isomerase [Methylococcales symbiont of Iophon sp. n. MRB-2018]|nr:MAG: peptidylprolyl isomerase [Methylococcales symbiont of Iophon sp. n. MRB-2018]KAF3979829.1 MAG: peptidylprolyl isomerase [Methylococcales symbiont of Iophon sp. n. MRB-2018]